MSFKRSNFLFVHDVGNDNSLQRIRHFIIFRPKTINVIVVHLSFLAEDDMVFSAKMTAIQHKYAIHTKSTLDKGKQATQF